MKAVTWHGKRDVRVEDGPRPDRSRSRPTRSCGSPRPNICGSDLHLYETLGAVHGRGRHPRPRADGHRRGGRRRGRRPQGRRPGGHAVPDLLRALLDVRPAALHPVRDHPGPRPGHGRRAVRLLQAVRRGARRPGGVPAGAAGAVHPHQGARRARRTSGSSTSPTCCRPPGSRWPTPTSPTAARCSCSGWARSATWPCRIALHQGVPGDRRRPGARAARPGPRRAASR